MKAAIYCRVSTEGQATSGLGLGAQKERCLAEVASRDWEVSTMVEETGTTRKRRPRLDQLMRELDVGLHDVLVVSRLDRLSRSMAEFGPLLERAQRGGWAILVLDPMLDLASPSGRMLAGVLISVAQWERDMASQRTREGLAELRRRGTTRDGRPFTPKPRYSDAAQIRRIKRLREQGMSLAGIAQFLTEAGVPSPGEVGRWNHRTVGRILKQEGVK